MSKIRVGLLINEFTVPFWVYKMIENINSGGYAEIVLVVKRKSAVVAEKNFFEKLDQNLKYGFFKLYSRIEKFTYKPVPDAFSEKNIEDLVKPAAFLEVDCIEKKFSDYIKDEDILKIKEYNVDVFLRLGFRILRGEILRASALGIWSYHHGDNFAYRGGPAGFWEIFKGEKKLGSILQILTEDLDGGEVLYRSWSSVANLHNKTLNSFYWKTSLFIPRKLKELYLSGKKAFLDKVKSENGNLYFYSDRNYTLPTNFEFLKLFLPLILRRIGHKIWKIFNFEQWILMYAFDNKDGPSTSIYRYKKIIPPRDRYWADPCVVYHDGKHYIFFEEVLYNGKTEKGRLCVIEIDRKGLRSDPVVILEKSYHLSYPFVFKDQGQYYLIPESQANSSVQLYKAIDFPYKWEFQMNLLENVKAMDSTIFYKNNKFWLFANVVGIEGALTTEELFLFSSDNLLSDKWESHLNNPIVSDVRSSRPAGRLFWNNGKLYRPSQDCSARYGYSTIINEIEVFDEKDYKEHKVTSIIPNWDNKTVATHTLSFDHGLSVIDATVKRRKRWLSPLKKTNKL